MLMTPAQRQTFFETLNRAYPNPKCELNWTNDFTLMVAIILSAQSTDKMVNRITPALFAAADTPQKMLDLGTEKITQLVSSINYFNNKTRSIMGLAKVLTEKYNGKMPTDFDTLLTLPGVGRKTANVFLNVAYHTPTIGVDTHVLRLINRLKLGVAKTPDEGISAGRIGQIYEPVIKRHLSDYMGLVFEQMCREYLLRYANDLPIIVSDIGQWWGTDSGAKKEVQIDIVGSPVDGDEYIIGSCKYRNDPIGVDELELIRHYADVFGKGKKYHFYIFSKSGFTKGLQDLSDQGEVKLITLNDMYR